MKYLIVRNGDTGPEFPIVFPESVNHRDVARLHRVGHCVVLAAGFCNIHPQVSAWGKSESIPMDGRPQDEAIIKRHFGFAG